MTYDIEHYAPADANVSIAGDVPARFAHLILDDLARDGEDAWYVQIEEWLTEEDTRAIYGMLTSYRAGVARIRVEGIETPVAVQVDNIASVVVP